MLPTSYLGFHNPSFASNDTKDGTIDQLELKKRTIGSSEDPSRPMEIGSQAKTSFMHLPQEVHQSVFSLLPGMSVITSISLVCQAFFNATSQDSFWEPILQREFPDFYKGIQDNNNSVLFKHDRKNVFMFAAASLKSALTMEFDRYISKSEIDKAREVMVKFAQAGFDTKRMKCS